MTKIACTLKGLFLAQILTFENSFFTKDKFLTFNMVYLIYVGGRKAGRRASAALLTFNMVYLIYVRGKKTSKRASMTLLTFNMIYLMFVRGKKRHTIIIHHAR